MFSQSLNERQSNLTFTELRQEEAYISGKKFEYSKDSLVDRKGLQAIVYLRNNLCEQQYKNKDKQPQSKKKIIVFRRKNRNAFQRRETIHGNCLSNS